MIRRSGDLGKNSKDTSGNMDSIDFANAANVNSGLATRRRLTQQSQVVDTMGRIHADMFFQDRYLLNEVGVKIKLIRSTVNELIACWNVDSPKVQ